MKDEAINIKDIKKTGESKPVPAVKKVEVDQTPSELFLEECDEKEAELFNEIKTTLIEKREKYEFEAVTEEMFDDYRNIITYMKRGIITIEDHGVSVKLRKPLKNSDGVDLTSSITVLFERNEALEKRYKTSVKTNKKSNNYENDMGTAVIAASFANVGNLPLGVNSLNNIKRKNENDYTLILNVYTFFRS